MDDLNGSDNLFRLPGNVETRWASAENWKGEKGAGAQTHGGRKGSACFRLGAGQSKTLAEASGTSGVVRRIWTTINLRDPKMLRGVRLDMYWDGASKPAVSAPIGDFFGQGLGRPVCFESALFSNPEGRSFCSFLPMPFKTGMKIVATNETDADIQMYFYDVNYTIGDALPEDVGYLHAHFRRENPTTLRQDYEFLPKVEGKGRFLGVNVGVIADRERYFSAWWGEGEAKFYLDGDEAYPTLCGTGTEDYIGTAWGQGTYSHWYQGAPICDGKNGQFTFYRWHIPDPVYFHKDLRVTMHQIGCASPETMEKFRQSGKTYYKTGPELEEMDLSAQGGLFEREDDWSSCAYFYLDKPENDLPELMPLEKRIEGLLEDEGASERQDV